MKSFYKTFPHLLAAKSLDGILNELKYDDYMRAKMFRFVHISFLMFKEFTKVYSFRDTFLDLLYKDRCRAIDRMKIHGAVKSHLKNIIHSGCRRHMLGISTNPFKQGNEK